jgi:hypothetical protein
MRRHLITQFSATNGNKQISQFRRTIYESFLQLHSITIKLYKFYITKTPCISHKDLVSSINRSNFMLWLKFVKFYRLGTIIVEECELQRSCLVTIMNPFLKSLACKFREKLHDFLHS